MRPRLNVCPAISARRAHRTRLPAHSHGRNRNERSNHRVLARTAHGNQASGAPVTRLEGGMACGHVTGRAHGTRSPGRSAGVAHSVAAAVMHIARHWSLRSEAWGAWCAVCGSRAPGAVDGGRRRCVRQAAGGRAVPRAEMARSVRRRARGRARVPSIVGGGNGYGCAPQVRRHIVGFEFAPHVSLVRDARSGSCTDVSGRRASVRRGGPGGVGPPNRTGGPSRTLS